MTAADLERIRAALAEGLSVRKGMIITDEIIRDRAANLTEYMREIVDDIVKAALIEAARGEVVAGTIGCGCRVVCAETTPHRGRCACICHGEIGGLDVAVGTVRAPSEMAMNGEQPCTRSKWCGDFEGHSGECIPPF